MDNLNFPNKRAAEQLLPNLYTDSKPPVVPRNKIPEKIRQGSSVTLPLIDSAPKRPMTGYISNQTNILLNPYIKSAISFPHPALKTIKTRCKTAGANIDYGGTGSSTNRGLGSLYDRLSRLNLNGGPNMSISTYQYPPRAQVNNNNLNPMCSRPFSQQLKQAYQEAKFNQAGMANSPYIPTDSEVSMRLPFQDNLMGNKSDTSSNLSRSVSSSSTGITIVPKSGFEKSQYDTFLDLEPSEIPFTLRGTSRVESASLHSLLSGRKKTSADQHPGIKSTEESTKFEIRRRPRSIGSPRPISSAKKKAQPKTNKTPSKGINSNSNNRSAKKIQSMLSEEENQYSRSRLHTANKSKKNLIAASALEPGNDLPSQIYQKLRNVGVGNTVPLIGAAEDKNETLKRLRKAYAILEKELNQLNIDEEEIISKGINYNEFAEKQKRELELVRHSANPQRNLIKDNRFAPNFRSKTPMTAQQMRKIFKTPTFDKSLLPDKIPLPKAGYTKPVIPHSTRLRVNSDKNNNNPISMLGKSARDVGTYYSSPLSAAEIVDSTVSTVLEGRKRLMVNSLVNSNGYKKHLEQRRANAYSRTINDISSSSSFEELKMKPFKPHPNRL